MNFDVLHNFISPVTGRVLCDPDYILVGSRNGIAIPSPILIDIRLDLIDIRKEIDDLEAINQRVGFIISEPDAALPKAQALSVLNDGFMYNTNGVVSTTNVLPLPSLSSEHLWIGDVNNSPVQLPNIKINNLPGLTQNKIWKGDAQGRPVEVEANNIENLPDLASNNLWIGDASNRPVANAVANATININNLPSLGVTGVPSATGFVGKIWEGTSSGRPKESSALATTIADLTSLNAKISNAKFVMNSGSILSFPSSQFLNDLTAGALVKTSSLGNGNLESVLLSQNQVLMGGANNTPESRARIGIDNLPTLAQNNLWIGDANSNPIAKSTINLSNLPALSSDKIWKGDAQGRPVEVEANNIENLPDLASNNLWIGDASNRPVANANLPDLAQNKIWKGDAQGRPVETDFNVAPDDATYILQEPNSDLTNAQVLSELGTGMAKIVAGGAFAIAIPDEDYATVETLNQIKAECEEFRNQAEQASTEAEQSANDASLSANSASTSAIEAAASASSATASAASATAAASAAAASATAAAASATAAGNSADNASDSADDAAASASEAQSYLNELLTTGITITGDVEGGGVLNEPIEVTFKENPVFTGNGSMTIPVGTTAERPVNPVVGMTRINTSF
jgi:hypothetical protein